MISQLFYRIKIDQNVPEIFYFKDIIYKTGGLNIFMCVFHVNGPNRFGAKLIGIGLKSHVNVVIVHHCTIYYKYTRQISEALAGLIQHAILL